MTCATHYQKIHSAAVDEWLHEIDLAGPAAAIEQLEALLDQAPDQRHPSARHLRGLILGRKGQIPKIQGDVELMAGVWAGIEMTPIARRHRPRRHVATIGSLAR